MGTLDVIDRALPFHPNYEKFYLHKANILVQLDRKDESIVILVMV